MVKSTVLLFLAKHFWRNHISRKPVQRFNICVLLSSTPFKTEIWGFHPHNSSFYLLLIKTLLEQCIILNRLYCLLNQWRNISFHMLIRSNKNPSICVETLIGSCWDRSVRRTAQSRQNCHSFLSSWQITIVQRSSVAETTLRPLPTTMAQDRPQLIVLTGQARAIFSGMNYPLQPQSEVLRRAALAFLRVQQWGGEAAAILDSWLDHCCRHAWVLVNICWGIAFNSRYIWAITMSSTTLFWPSFCCNKDEISFHLWTLQTRFFWLEGGIKLE